MIGNFGLIACVIEDADLGDFTFEDLSGVKAAARIILLLTEDHCAAGFQIPNIDRSLKCGLAVNINL